MLKAVIKDHKRVIFNGDNYSEEWHKEAEKRGLPHLKDSVTAIPVLGQKKSKDLFKKYKILTPAEVDSRVAIFTDKYAMQIQIESEQMVLMARQLILPAALRHQSMLAEAVASTQGAGVETESEVRALEHFVDLLGRFREKVDALDEADNASEEDPGAHIKLFASKIRPLMDDVRVLGDELETHVAADLWPLPSYREMLFIR